MLENIATHWIGEAISGIKYHILDIGIAMEHLVLEAELSRFLPFFSAPADVAVIAEVSNHLFIPG